MNLFEMVEQNCLSMPSEVNEGVRLQRMELLNWGTFHHKIWVLNLDGETSLLTGDVGSGKSSVVDAITTLLVPPQKAAYNKAADASAKERTPATYFFGHYAQEEGYEGSSKPLALRTKKDYSVLLAEFRNEFHDTTVTLAQLLYYTGNENQSYPKRIHIIFEGSLSIAKDFSRFTGDAREIKGRLKGKGCLIYDDFASYSASFRKIFGNMNEQAINLFAQTISMKTVDKLNPFIRTNMLEPDSGIRATIDHLIGHYKSLNDAYQDICNAKKKIEMLLPMEDASAVYHREKDAAFLYERALHYLPHWVAKEKLALLEQTVIELGKRLELEKLRFPKEQAKQEQLEGDILQLRHEIYAQGGERLERLKADVTRLIQTEQRRKSEVERYRKDGDLVSIPVPTDHGTFLKNSERIHDQLELLDRQHQVWNADLQSVQHEILDKTQAQSNCSQELQSLHGRTSNLPRNFIQLRDALCKDLQLTHDMLPFVGELLEVQEAESQWEGALERLLRPFALSLLVPESHYDKVSNWIERTNLKMRLVYYMVSEKQVFPELGQLHPDCALQKLKIKEGTPYYRWIVNELQHRANHVCCDSVENFMRQPKAVTMGGQVKSKQRHEKDDQHSIHDRGRYVMGFSNEKKITLLEGELAQLNEILGHLAQRKKVLEQELRQEVVQRNALIRLQDKDDFESLDVASITIKLREVREEILQIETCNDVLKILEQRMETLVEKKKKQDTVIQQLHTDIERSKDKVEAALNDQKENQGLAQGEVPAEIDTVLTRLGQPELIAALSQWDVRSKKLQNTLDAQQKDGQKKSNEAAQSIIKYMVHFSNQFPNECTEFDNDLQSLNEFLQILEQCRKHDLPRHEAKFKADLQKNLLKNIGIFHQKINESSQRIQLKIDQINQSLRGIHFNRGTYIAVGCQETRDTEIIAFRHQLRQCTEGSAQGFRDVTVAEAKFHQIKAIIDRLDGREGFSDLDKRWRQKVTDVRYWHDFSASERNQETEVQIEYYTDSGGKSGGQKEKLAYTILAAGLAYNFNLTNRSQRSDSFRFVIIDEAFLKSSDESTRFGLELFRTLGFQLLIVTPLLKITTIEPYISSVGLVQQNKETNQSSMQSISVETYQQMRREQE